MPYRPKDIYRGRRKFRVPLNIFLFAVVFLLVGTVGAFYFLQQYIVYDATGVHLEFSGGKDEPVPEESAPTPEPTFEPVTVEVIWEDPDFSEIDLGGWEELEPVHDRFIAFQDVVDPDQLTAAVASVTEGDFYTGAVLEMKGPAGQLAWPSASNTAVAFGTGGGTDVSGVIAALHGAGKTVSAQISCFADSLLTARNWTVALQSGGAPYVDGDGKAWVDPYNRTERTYLTELAAELAAMGFDEIILADLYHPISEAGFTYSVTLRTPPDPVVAVCQEGKRIVEALDGTGTAVSVRLDGSSLRNGLGAQTGQDIDIFWRLFARLYCPTWPDQLAADMELATESMSGGEADTRFVAIMGQIPEGCESYVIAG